MNIATIKQYPRPLRRNNVSDAALDLPIPYAPVQSAPALTDAVLSKHLLHMTDAEVIYAIARREGFPDVASWEIAERAKWEQQIASGAIINKREFLRERGFAGEDIDADPFAEEFTGYSRAELDAMRA